MENPYELLYMSRTGDEWAQTALFQMYMPMLKAEVAKVLLGFPRMELYREDIEQEVSMCILKAADNYRSDLNCGFTTFLIFIARRRIYSLLRQYSGTTYVNMHDTVALDGLVSDNSSLGETLPDKESLLNPDYYFRYKTAREKLQETVKGLNERESAVLDAWVRDLSYKQAAEQLGITYKTFDGRFQRLRRKIIRSVLEDS